jgi:hypothetical protein
MHFTRDVVGDQVEPVQDHSWDNITPPNGVKWSSMLAPVGSGGLGQKKPPIFWIGWGLT